MQCHRRLAYRLALTAAVALSPLSLSNESFAHGGRYGGPSDSVPPNLGGGGDGTPGGPGNPGTPGPGARRPVARAGRRPAALDGSSDCRPARRRTDRRPDEGQGDRGYDQWEFWWENNDDPYLR
jgi:hypothetical protein